MFGKKTIFISKKWRFPWVIIALFVAELAFTIPVLALFSIADPDLYRTRLWQDGFDNGFNSSPKTVLFCYANHRTNCKTPLVWSSFLTSYNVVISVLSTFLLLVKAVMFILHCWYPMLSTLIHAILTGLWAFSAAAQAHPDLSDPDHPQTGPPWYLTKSCSVAHFQSNVGYCRQAKAAFGITIIIAFLFGANTIWAIWSMIPSKEERIERKKDIEEDEELEKEDDVDYSWELSNLPKTPAAQAFPLSPVTPRTQAFRTLGGGGGGGGGDLPLRDRYS